MTTAMLQRGWTAAALAAAGLAAAPAGAGEWDLGASVAYDARAFLNDPAFPGQFEGVQSSLVLEGDIYWESDDRDWQFVLLPFARLDGQDEERTHADLREGYLRWNGDAWNVRAGVGKVFWGVTEARQLVDIINQTDSVEDIDEEDKLGQPMIEISNQRDWGRLTFFVLPGFRERTFPGSGGRLRGPLAVDADAAEYESADEERRVDVAGSYSQFFGDWDVRLSAFHGTSREPQLRLNETATAFTPFYSIITQVGADVQLTRDAWLWKFEGVVREGQGDTFAAVNAGFEYTFFGVTESGADLGILLEYLYDGRDDDPSIAPPTTQENDVFFGARYALNDAQDTSILAGGVTDAENGSTAGLVEAERRVGENWVVELTARFTVNVDDADALAPFSEDDAVTLRLTRFF